MKQMSSITREKLTADGVPGAFATVFLPLGGRRLAAATPAIKENEKGVREFGSKKR
jgi:hypothetical protein